MTISYFTTVTNKSLHFTGIQNGYEHATNTSVQTLLT